jgi:hypothetical protein
LWPGYLQRTAVPSARYSVKVSSRVPKASLVPNTVDEDEHVFG